MADEYINKTELLFEMTTSLIPQDYEITRAYAIAKDIIKKAPTADVAPVVHGKWTGMEGDVCSECGRSLTDIMDADSYFAIGFNPSELVACPFCGARMDGGKPND